MAVTAQAMFYLKESGKRMAKPIILFDTEFTSWAGAQERNWSGENEHREIVQLGALKLDPANGYEVLDKQILFAKPVKNPTLSDYFMRLTGITQQEVDAYGLSYPELQREFAKFITDCDVWSYGGDEKVMAENCQIHDIPTLEQGRFYDMRQVVEGLGFNPKKYNSGTLYRAVAPDVADIQAHNALNDCQSMAIFLQTCGQQKQLSYDKLLELSAA